MKPIQILAVCSLAAALAGCGSSGTSTTSSTVTTASVSGYVADGYLRNATIFLDLNNNLQLDAGEPSTTSGPGGYYRLTNLDPALMQYPVVVLAQAGVTVDEDTPNQPIANSYLLCAPPGGTDFVSPISTLVQQLMVANPTMTLAQAVEQVRQGLGLPVGANPLANYITGNNTALHSMAQEMVALMMEQRTQIMQFADGTGIDPLKYRSMIQTMSQYMTQLYQNVAAEPAVQAVFRQTMRDRITTGFMR